METVFTSADQLIGATPMVALSRFENVLAKLESRNIAGSVKDRVAKAMLDDMEQSGHLKAGGHIIEPTSGSTGIALAALCAQRGYRCTIVMPETMSMERRQLIAAYGAQVMLSPAAEGMNGAIRLAEELAQQDSGSIIAGQFTNPANPHAHFTTTGPEIWQQTQGKVDIFVACVGTGGTLTGVGRYLKSQNPNVRIVAVEPAASAVLSGVMFNIISRGVSGRFSALERTWVMMATAAVCFTVFCTFFWLSCFLSLSRCKWRNRSILTCPVRYCITLASTMWSHLPWKPLLVRWV